MVVTRQQLSFRFAQAVSAVGALVVAALVLLDTTWVERWLDVLLLVAATLGLRVFRLALGKYAYISQVGVVALAGALLIGPEPTVLAVAAGTFFGDWGWLRRDAQSAWVNAAREVVALVAAFGFYVLAFRWSGAPAPLATEALPALTTLVGSYFLISRTLFYFTLLVRSKLSADERIVMLRYEVAGYGLTLFLAGTAVLMVQLLPALAWPFVATPALFVAFLVNRILEEALEAEELNKINAMEVVIISSVDLEDALVRLEALAHRVLDWREFRVYRREGTRCACFIADASASERARSRPHSRISGPRCSKPAGAWWSMKPSGTRARCICRPRSRAW